MKLVEQTSQLTIDDPSVASSSSPERETTPSEMASTNSTTSSASKPKRVRTGCLTCRERHLKCDEGSPVCQNCKKSNRECKRGMRLNFIDTKVEDHPIIPPTGEWKVDFQDESREIAAEYKGGAGLYRHVFHVDDKMDVKPDTFSGDSDNAPNTTNAPVIPHRQLPPIVSTPPDTATSYTPPKQADRTGNMHHPHPSTDSNSSYPIYTPSEFSYASDDTMANQEQYQPLTNPDEVLFMQVFIEEVGIWMDSMDRHKHFSKILPFFALREPMLCSALLACGARHLTLVNPAFHEDRAIHYYDKATRALLKSLQNPNRDTIICATAAVVLNVYEVMSERALQRMNHIAGARALVKECRWSAMSQGIGLACFWLNVGMELLSCLHFNWQVAWNPDDWGVDIRMEPDLGVGTEEDWTYKMVYITAKVANFRASIPRFQEANPTLQDMRTRRRVDEWESYKKMCDDWINCIPLTMRPLAVLQAHHTATRSQFQEICYIKRTSITAQLFYHTAMTLLPQMHPTKSAHSPEMYQLKMHHAHQICGIVAHVKDRGVASAAIRTLAIAAECLTDFKEQSEILTILSKIKKETGWRIDFITPELRSKWGWTEEYVQRMQHEQRMQESFQGMMQSPPSDYLTYQPQQQTQQQQTNGLSPPILAHPPLQQTVPAPASAQTSVPTQSENASTNGASAHSRIPSGIVNPMMRAADFTAAQHPYQNSYVPPNQPHNDSHYIYRAVDHNGYHHHGHPHSHGHR